MHGKAPNACPLTFVGGRKFSITHSSLLDTSSTLNAKRLLSG